MSQDADEQIGNPLGIIYVSAATRLMSPAEIAEILQSARKNNERHGITGLLAYWEGNFIQYIEGAPEKLEQLMRNLRNDRRHRSLIELQRKPIAARAFPEWSMSFDYYKASNVEGASDFLSSGFLKADPAVLAPDVRILLDVFREHMR